MVNDDAARIVARYLAFREGVAYGIDHLLEPPGLGAHCDTLENRTTYVSEASPPPTSTQAEEEFLLSSCFSFRPVPGSLWLLPKASTLPLP